MKRWKYAVGGICAVIAAILLTLWVVPSPTEKTVNEVSVSPPEPLANESHASPLEPCDEGCDKYDVVVIGSEIQGVLLAREARNHGLRVLILDPRSKPGGELTLAQMQFLDEPNDKNKQSLVQGDIKPLFDGYKRGTIRTAAEFDEYYNKMVQGIPMQSGIEIQSVESNALEQGKTLTMLTYKMPDATIHKVQANYWVENTDFAALTGKLGATRIPGMESLYNGDHEEPDYMAATLMLRFKKVNWGALHQAVLEDYPLTNVQEKYGPNTYVDWNIATGFSNIMSQYKPQDPQLVLRGMNTVDQKHGEVIMNALLIYGVDPADPASVQEAVRKGREEAPFVLEFLRENIPGFAKAELNGFPEYLYIRDYNRYETEYVLQYDDVKNSRMFWDNVSIGGYSIDLQGTQKIPKGIGFGKTDRYGMPLRSFELKGYDNVLVVGKNVGASIKAYGSARIMPNTALAAQTLGIILGREQDKRLQELTPDDFKRIHAYLQKDYDIVLNH
ncbi:FAD-dependent oxidoreductase [Paenibacillus sp. P96]|uniref:FAD-dependent oxidoreductase n=1 Tax=Paenibacillus zeirhizosphaerae TaxID=2987519 RepID=A0ABT9FRE9_9BACL|nr:FAD-dependent oxidoreductase [Paenibacillus sp. P96]MDP4097313.1 FAD-dependent oxidoreductase [Paenibacillus sp. P96]